MIPGLHHLTDLNVRRWNKVTHCVTEGLEVPQVLQFNAQGRPTIPNLGFIVHLACGRYAKINDTSNNQFTEDAPTCFECMVKDII